jgi:uncharacterized metal-binding protein
MELKCSICRVRACAEEPHKANYPGFCPMNGPGVDALNHAHTRYDEEATRQLAVAAAQTEAVGYCQWPRVQEIMDFARRIGAERLGIAHCVGLQYEAGLLQGILEANGFQVFSACCKVGSIPKEQIGLQDAEKICPGEFEVLCNPIGQAELLKAAKTELNIVVGLCVGHDSMFFRHSGAPVTVLVAKDRVTGHNPAAALYTSHSYYQRLKLGSASQLLAKDGAMALGEDGS